MDQDRGIRDPKYVEYVPNTCQIRGPECPNTWNTCQNAAIRANTCPTYANTCEYVSSEVTYSTSEYVGHVSSGCLARPPHQHVARYQVPQIWAEWCFSCLFSYKTEYNNNFLYHMSRISSIPTPRPYAPTCNTHLHTNTRPGLHTTNRVVPRAS